MILEIADIRIPPGKQAEFDAAIQRGVETVVSKAKGFRRYQVQKGIESPERYVLLIEWETLENHTVDSAADRCSRNGERSSGPTSRRRR
jgi:heme-degrading monooxygenase HmoA